VQILDLLVSRYAKEKIKGKIEKYQPDIIGTTSVTLNFHTASKILKYCKSVNKDIITIFGGPHVTFTAGETLTEAPWIDVVVRGKGEMTTLDIVNGKKLAEIDGITYRIAELVPYPFQQINDKITKWAKEGLLKYNLKDGHLVWRWG